MDLIWVMLDYLRSVIVGLRLILKFGLDPIYSFGDTGNYFSEFWFEIAYSRTFWRVFRHIPSNDVTHRYNPQTATPCTETRRLSHNAIKA